MQASTLAKSLCRHPAALTSIQGTSLTVCRAVSVDVKNNNVEAALRVLKRKLIEEGLLKLWKKKEYRITPTEQRVLDRKETEKRLARREFKAKLQWILRRKARGF